MCEFWSPKALFFTSVLGFLSMILGLVVMVSVGYDQLYCEIHCPEIPHEEGDVHHQHQHRFLAENDTFVPSRAPSNSPSNSPSFVLSTQTPTKTGVPSLSPLEPIITPLPENTLAPTTLEPQTCKAKISKTSVLSLQREFYAGFILLCLGWMVSFVGTLQAYQKSEKLLRDRERIDVSLNEFELDLESFSDETSLRRTAATASKLQEIRQEEEEEDFDRMQLI